MINLFDLTGKTAIVTGASSGLGVQMAKALAGAGANVAIVARRLERLEAVKKEIEAFGVNCLAVKADVTLENEVEAAAKTVIDAWGRIDILVNNSGISRGADTVGLAKSDWQQVIDTNLSGVFLCSKHVGKYMQENKYGKIINITSMYGAVGDTLPAIAYYSSKGGIVNFTRALAAEWAKNGITVNAIGPGFFMSELTEGVINDEFKSYVAIKAPIGRIGNEGELDGTLLLLASDASSYITGQTIYVDGGWTCV